MAKKKEKIVWVDDGRTVADMSGVGSALNSSPKAPKTVRAYSPLREKLRTFFDTMGFMLLPTLCIMALVAAAFLIFWLLF